MTTLYTCLIEEADPEEPFIQVYWAHAEHLGEALERMVAAAALNGLSHPHCKQADPFEPADLREDLSRSADGLTLWANQRYFFEGPPGFTPPYGVIASCIEGDFDMDDVQVGYQLSHTDGLYTVEANTTGDRLLSDYLALIHANEPLRVFWIKVHDHWTDAPADQLYVNEDITSADDVAAFLTANLANTLRNGYVTITGYAVEGATNINITDHKKLVVLTRSEAIANRAAECLEQQGYPRLDPFVTIDDRIHHWHYRDPHSMDSPEFILQLQSNGFHQWQPPEE